MSGGLGSSVDRSLALIDKGVDELVARCVRAEEALRLARGYVEEPGAPGTVIETTEESAERSKALLNEIDEILGLAAVPEENQPGRGEAANRGGGRMDTWGDVG